MEWRETKQRNLGLVASEEQSTGKDGRQSRQWKKKAYTPVGKQTWVETGEAEARLNNI